MSGTEYSTGAHRNGAGIFFCRCRARIMQVSSGSTSQITDTGTVERRRSSRTSSAWGHMPQNSRIPGTGLRHIAGNFSQARSSPETVPSPYRIRQQSGTVFSGKKWVTDRTGICPAYASWAHSRAMYSQADSISTDFRVAAGTRFDMRRISIPTRLFLSS